MKNPKEEQWLKLEAKEEITEMSAKKMSKYSKSDRREVRDSIYAKKDVLSSGLPFFEKYIETDKKYMFCLPRTFAKKYLPSKNTTIILTNEKGNSCEVKFNLLGGCYPHFYGGWVSFMRKNKLNLGDRCIFELVNEKELMFTFLV